MVVMDHDDHQKDQECPPSMVMFLMALIATNTHVSYIFLESSYEMWLSSSDARHHDDHQGMSSGMSTKCGDVLDGFNCNKYPCIIYFWNPQTKCDVRHHDDHQEYQDDQECPQECPPSMGMFLMALIATNTHVSYIFGILK